MWMNDKRAKQQLMHAIAEDTRAKAFSHAISFIIAFPHFANTQTLSLALCFTLTSIHSLRFHIETLHATTLLVHVMTQTRTLPFGFLLALAHLAHAKTQRKGSKMNGRKGKGMKEKNRTAQNIWYIFIYRTQYQPPTFHIPSIRFIFCWRTFVFGFSSLSLSSYFFLVVPFVLLLLLLLLFGLMCFKHSINTFFHFAHILYV